MQYLNITSFICSPLQREHSQPMSLNPSTADHISWNSGSLATDALF